MTTIKALKTFSDGAISLHEGQIANVPDAKAQLFITEGYAVEYTGEGQKKLAGKKVLFLGDSITALEGDRAWTKYFCDYTGAQKIANVAVNGASLHNQSNTVLDGNPIAPNTNNTLANQVQKIINEGYEAPDLIIIAIGTNGGIPAHDNILALTWGDTPIPLSELTLSFGESAFRYCTETLHNLYPNAMIVWCTPIHAYARKPADIYTWSEHLKLLTSYEGVVCVETHRCGIMQANEVSNGNGEDLADGLHPNAHGAQKMARYNANAISRLFL